MPENKDDKKTFSYVYSAKRQEEIKNIQQKYASSQEDKLPQLRKLDASATHGGMIISVSLGVVSTLLFGIGMCCTMLWTDYFALGIAVGIIGIAGIAAAFPLYSAIVKRKRSQLAPLILQLCCELMDNTN